MITRLLRSCETRLGMTGWVVWFWDSIAGYKVVQLFSLVCLSLRVASWLNSGEAFVTASRFSNFMFSSGYCYVSRWIKMVISSLRLGVLTTACIFLLDLTVLLMILQMLGGLREVSKLQKVCLDMDVTAEASPLKKDSRVNPYHQNELKTQTRDQNLFIKIIGNVWNDRARWWGRKNCQSCAGRRRRRRIACWWNCGLTSKTNSNWRASRRRWNIRRARRNSLTASTFSWHHHRCGTTASGVGVDR